MYHGYGGSQDNTFEIVVYFVALFVVFAAYYFYVFMRRRGIARLQDGPVLSSDEMLGTGGLQSMSKGAIAGFEYNLLTNDSGRVMFLVELGHNSWSHIIAYGDKSRMSDFTNSLVSKKWLEPASLEGDFPDYFHMFCNPEAQDVLRELFTPDVMANFEDFCRSYDCELFHDTLYFSRAANIVDGDDQTTLTSDITDFLQRNADVLRRL